MAKKSGLGKGLDALFGARIFRRIRKIKRTRKIDYKGDLKNDRFTYAYNIF